MNMKSSLEFQLSEVASLKEIVLQRMYFLMNENYNKVSESNFYSDLNKKDWVGLITNESGKIQGFTTFAINPAGSGTKSYNILFSGDTILAPEHWGSQVMMQGWCNSVGRFIAGDPDKLWYWYLLSKGHRTYMYLPLFFQHYFPAINPGEEYSQLTKVANEVSIKLFDKYWIPEDGVIRFDQSLGELKPELTEATYQKKGSDFVKFFIEKNPGFFKGEELVCIGLIDPEYLLRSAKTLVLEGMKDPISIKIT
jgi:hypothetical protein